MRYSVADLDYARREVVGIEAQIDYVRARITIIERESRDAKDARLLLGHLEQARRQCVERLGKIRRAIGPSAH